MSDTIDRQAAIDRAVSIPMFGRDVKMVAVGEIKNLPSAQPEIDEWCTDCKEYDHEKHCCPRFNKVIRTALQDAQPETAKRIVGKSRDGMTLWYQCDMCNEPVDVQDIYCRGCGRRLIDE